MTRARGAARGAGCNAAHRAMRRGGAMGTSRPTATGPNGKWIERWDTGSAHGAGWGRRATGRARAMVRNGRGQRRGMQSRAPRRSAAARWGHRALPQRDRMANGPGNGKRAVRTGGTGGRCASRVLNGGRARCPHRAARVMRGGNGGRARWRGAGARAGRARARETKPRTAVATRAGG